MFSKALETKAEGRLINSSHLWMEVVWHKYIAPISISEWIRNPFRGGREILSIWEAVLNSLEVIRSGLAWKVGNGNKVRIGWDPWLGCRNDHIQPLELVECLEQSNVLYLSQVGDHEASTIHSQGWKWNLFGVV